jgi:hypothetical protein
MPEGYIECAGYHVALKDTFQEVSTEHTWTYLSNVAMRTYLPSNHPEPPKDIEFPQMLVGYWLAFFKTLSGFNAERFRMVSEILLRDYDNAVEAHKVFIRTLEKPLREYYERTWGSDELIAVGDRIGLTGRPLFYF